jgi:O-antigen/teichoic acid export membrane protein
MDLLEQRGEPGPTEPPESAPESGSAGLGGRVAKAAAWMVLLRFVVRGIGVVSQLILVRVLAPEDFGLIASSTVIYNMLDMLSELSISLALMQTPNPGPLLYNTAWTMGMLRGAIIGGALLLIAPFVGDYMRDPRVTDIVRVLSVAPLLQGLESVGMVTLRRNLRFERLFFYQLLNKVLGFLIAVPVAIVYRSYWALVLGGFAARFLTIPLSYVFAPHRPGFSLRHVRELLHFSRWLFVNNLLTMVDNSVMTVTLGRLAGARELGLYQVSLDLGAMPASEVAAPIRGPMYAGYARVADDPAALRDQVVDGLALLLTVILPMSIGIAVTSDYAVHVALGDKWADAVPIVSFCSLFALFDALGHFTGNVYIVRHAQRPYVVIMAIGLALRVAMVVPAALGYGVLGAVAAIALSALINMILWFAFMRRLILVQWIDLIRVSWRAVAATSAMAAAVLAAQMAWSRPIAPAETFVRWALLCGLGAAVQIGVQSALWYAGGCPSGPEERLLGALPALLARAGLRKRR